MNNAQQDRGRISKIKLSRAIKLNGFIIKQAIIEIDHINYGLDKNTKKLNIKKRLNFTIRDIEKFIMSLDEEMLPVERTVGSINTFMVRIDCPVQGRYFDKEFTMIFQLDHKCPEEIYTVTLFPNW